MHDPDMVKLLLTREEHNALFRILAALADPERAQAALPPDLLPHRFQIYDAVCLK